MVVITAIIKCGKEKYKILVDRAATVVNGVFLQEPSKGYIREFMEMTR